MILAKTHGTLEEVKHRKRPVVTLSWAQSLNGTIAHKVGEKTTLSSPQSMEKTHVLRSYHQGLMVGIGTVLADDPQLNVRLAPGPSPIPMILDTKLRIPLGAKVLAREDQKPWIFYSEGSEEKIKKLQDLGAWVFHVPWSNAGVDIKAVLEVLAAEAIHSLMVEGGSQVLSTFLREKLADQVVITLCPQLMSGVPGVDFTHYPGGREVFERSAWEAVGTDLLFWGRFKA